MRKDFFSLWTKTVAECGRKKVRKSPTTLSFPRPISPLGIINEITPPHTLAKGSEEGEEYIFLTFKCGD